MIHWLNLVFLFLAVLASLWALYRQLRPAELKPIGVSPRAYTMCLIIVVFLAVLIRVWRFGQVPGGMNQDGAMAAVDALALARYGTDRYGMSWPVHLTAWGYGQMSALNSYLMIPFIKLLGLSVVSARAPQLIVSLLGLGALHLFCRKAFGPWAALTVLALGAISPWHVLQSRWALDCDLLPHFFLFGMSFLLYGLEGDRRNLKLGLSMVCFGLCMYCYGIALYTVPFFLVISCAVLLLRKQVTWRQALLCVSAWLAIAWPFLLTMAINFFRWDTVEILGITMPYFPDSVRSADILFFSEDFLSQLVSNLHSMFRVVLLQKDSLPWNNVPGWDYSFPYGTVYLFTLPFALMGLVWLIRRWKKEAGAALVLLALITGIWCGICTNGVNTNRINQIFYPIIILGGLGIFQTAKALNRRSLALGLCLMYLVAFASFAGTYFTSYARQMSYYFMEDFGQAVSYLKDSQASRLYITAHSQYESSANVSEILTMFYHQVDAEYYQGVREIDGLLPYDERYSYPTAPQPDPEGDAAYVLYKDQIGAFDLEGYKVTEFGDYYVLEEEP